MTVPNQIASKANKVAVVALVVMAVGIGALMLVIRNSTTEGARAYFDNGLDQAVSIDVDGRQVATVPAHSAAQDDLVVGRHRVKVADAKGKLVEEVDIEVPSAQGITEHRFAYNVGKKSRYMTMTIGYGNTRPDAKQASVGDNLQFFELPTTTALFLPYDAVSEKGRAGSTVALVFHAPPHKDWPCCANYRQAVKVGERK